MGSVSVIEQHPYYTILPVGQEVIFVVSNNDAVANEIKVKFCAEVHINTTTPNLSGTASLVGTFKTTPNDAGVGIFDFRNILENYVSADNLAYFSDLASSSYKGVSTTASRRQPIHLIDKWSGNFNTQRHLGIRFFVEYENANGQVVEDEDSSVDSADYIIFNGYLKYSDNISLIGKNFGYSLSAFALMDSSKEFLTNAPTTQYANSGDYGTVAFLRSAPASTNLAYVKFKYYNASGIISNEDVMNSNVSSGSGFSTITNSDSAYIFLGCFPGNLENWSSTYTSAVSSGLTYYTITAYSSTDVAISQTYRINISCPDLRNYEPIRLAWLNQWGAWDYYTFTKKSTKTLTTKGTTYTQLEGTWNEQQYRLNSYRGGKKTFRVNATEKIKINTDFLTESYNVMFEELTNSPEIYILEGYKEDPPSSMLNQYVTPVRLISKNFTTKTIANDRLIQYSFEIEKTKTLRTQSV